MKSRYDFMKPGKVIDSETGSLYPDPLSLNYHEFEINIMPTSVELADDDIEFFWRTTEKQLGIPYLDDVVLSLNGVPHRNFLKEGDVVLFPDVGDIKKSFAE